MSTEPTTEKELAEKEPEDDADELLDRILSGILWATGGLLVLLLVVWLAIKTR